MTCRSGVCASVTRSSLSDSSMARDRAFLFLGSFRMILLKSTHTLQIRFIPIE